MEINNHFEHHPHKDIPSQLIYMPQEPPGPPDPAITPGNLQSQILNLENYYRVQEDALVRQFENRRRMLAHEHQVRSHEQQMVMFQKRQQEAIEQQKKLEQEQLEQQEHLKQHKIAELKNKKKSEESAIASNEVKLKLRECLLNKNKHSPPDYRHWSKQHSSLEQHSPPQSGLSPPLRGHLLARYDEEYPLRKTVSEPNLKMRSKILLRQMQRSSPLVQRRDGLMALKKKNPLTTSEPNLKVRLALKQKMIERRSSPLLRRKERFAAKRNTTPLTIDTTLSNSNPDSGPNSPPSGTSQGSQGSVGETPPPGPKEDGGAGQTGAGGNKFPLEMMSKMVINQSMPNISLGQHSRAAAAGAGAGAGGDNVALALTEAEVRARLAAQHGLPLTQHMLTGPLPYYPVPHHPDSTGSSPGGNIPMAPGGVEPAYLEAQMKALELARSTGQIPQMSPLGHNAPGYTLPPNAAAAAAVAAMSEARLKRTNSAPLPLPGQLMLQHQLLLQHQEQFLKENQKHYLKQRLASSIMARSGSKNHMENVDEEVEARLVQEMRGEGATDEDGRHGGYEGVEAGGGGGAGEELDLSQRHPAPPPQHLHRRTADREMFLLKMRQRALQAESPPSAASAAPSSMSATVSPVGGAAKLLVHAHSSPAQFSLPAAARSSASASTSASLDDEDEEEGNVDSNTGLAYDPVMLQHTCLCGNDAMHPENPSRMHAIYCRLQETGLLSQCQRVPSRKARLEELQSCHSEAYTLLYGSNPKKLADPKLDPNIFEPLIQRFCKLPCGGIGVDSDTVWNEAKSPTAARVAAGCVIELAFKVATEQLQNGFALVRPPGHHAEPTQAMGFCFFNSIAVATKQLLDKLKLRKVLIVDWDVHHGNSTQQIFYADPRVLYVSLHRHDNANFFPGTGAPEECGIDRGTGFNVNVAWSGGLNPPMGDADYLAAFRTVVLPIARKFNPEIVLVSAGFDGAAGHPAPLGGYNISPECFGFLTKQLQTLAQGKLVLVLEGGYEQKPVCDATEMCLRTLLGQEVPLMKEDELCRPPCANAIEALTQTLEIQARFWPCVRQFASSVHMSAIEAQRMMAAAAAAAAGAPAGEDTAMDTVNAFASLSVVHEKPSGCEGEESSQPSEPMEQS